MATRARRYCWSTALIAGLLVTTAPAQMPTFSVKAVRVNPECVGGANAGEHCTRDEDCESLDCSGAITPTDCIAPYPGDVIVAELFASEWTRENQDEPVLSGYKAMFLIEKFQAELPAQGELIPFRGPRPCKHNYECLDLPAACVGGFCDTTNDKAGGAFIRIFRVDYVFLGWPVLLGVDTSYNYRFAAFLSNPNDGLVYEPPPKYCGTLILTVSDDACGVFTVAAYPVLYDFWWRPILPRETEPLIIDVPGCCVYPQFVTTYPPNCAIDARKASDPDGSNRVGWDSIEITFADCVDTSKLGSEDFSVREFPLSLPRPFIVQVVPNGNKAAVQLNREITLQAWTCVTYLASGEEVCLAHLPGDVNNDGTSGPSDILWLIDCLNGVRSCGKRIWQCDIDWSGVCGPPDILWLIDLLNGAGAYDSWLNRSLPECPSAP